MALTIRFTPGRVVALGDIITEDVLNDLANPTVELEGTISGATIADDSITLPMLVTGILSADSAGRARMEAGYVTAEKLNATQDWTGKTLEGAPTVNWVDAIISPPVGWPVQFANTSLTNFTSVTALIPFDDTIPQDSEGTQLLSAAITPKSATNQLLIRVVVPALWSNIGTVTIALFNSTVSGAIAATSMTQSVGLGGILVLEHVVVAGGTSPLTFNVRLGNSDGTNAVNINGAAGSRKLGGVQAATLSITEITA